MLVRVPLLVAVVLAAFVVTPPLAVAKPKQCFTPREESAEQIVRYGLRLREGARICSDPPYNADVMPQWQAVDQQFGPRFAQEKAIRARAFRREFGNDAVNRLEMWNGRVVLMFRNYPASPEFCANVATTLGTIRQKGWGYVTRMAAKARDEVRMDFRPCR